MSVKMFLFDKLKLIFTGGFLNWGITDLQEMNNSRKYHYPIIWSVCSIYASNQYDMYLPMLFYTRWFNTTKRCWQFWKVYEMVPFLLFKFISFKWHFLFTILYLTIDFKQIDKSEFHILSKHYFMKGKSEWIFV